MNPAGQDSFVNKIKEASQDATNTVSRNVGAQNLGWGSGAEQDRYASHFGLGHDGLERVREATLAKGVGAEQDRYAAHFTTLDEQRVQQAKEAIFNSGTSGAEQDRYQARFGLGHDGLERVKAFANQKGLGAEQDRYQEHFGLDDAKIERALDAAKKGLMK